MYRVDGKPHPHRLCEKNRNTGHGSKSPTAVRESAEDFMREVNGDDGVQPQGLTIAEFWESTNLPFITDDLKPSPVYGYRQVYKQTSAHTSVLPC